MFRVFLIIAVLLNKSCYLWGLQFYYLNDLTKSWYDPIIGVTTHSGAIPKDCVSWALFTDSINETGFAQLEVHTNGDHTDSNQAYHAGFIEGYLTADLMGMHWRNIQLDTYCDNHTEYCTRLFDFLNTNLKYTHENAKWRRTKNSYWHHVGLVLEQLTGLQDGYNLKLWNHHPKGPRMEVDSQGMISLNIFPELFELEYVMKKSDNEKGRDGSCSALVKPLDDGSDLFTSHNTWVFYNAMLRIIKKYEFNYHRFENSSELIGGKLMAFDSYPGAVYSMSDFYILSSGLVVMETSLANYNKKLWKRVTPDNSVLAFIRNIVANRLATNGKEWTDIFSMYNSGTYNNQFMIVDYNKFKKGTLIKDLSDDLLWIIEQMPGKTMAADVSNVLRKRGFWASYNVPYFEQIYNMSHYPEMAQQYGDYFTYYNTARAKIFKRDNVLVHDLPSMYKLMRYNDFKHDELSRCNCTPPFSAEYAIAGRNDLNDPNGTYSFNELKLRNWGAIDAKITNKDMSINLQMLMVSSPSYQHQEPFQWSSTMLPEVIRHEGHPDKWAFAPYFLKWFPLENEIADLEFVEPSPAILS